MRTTFQNRYATILMCMVLASQLSYAQSISNDDGSRSISLARFQSLIRLPGGIEKIAGIIGNFSFDEPAERWGEPDLPALSRSSSLIVRAVLKKSDVTLSEDGNSVDTVYAVDVRKALKGEPVGQTAFKCRGGKITLPDGHTVTMHSAMFDNLVIGREYIFFLADHDDLRPVGGMESVFEVSADSQTAHLLDRNPDRSHELRYLDGERLNMIEQEVRKSTS